MTFNTLTEGTYSNQTITVTDAAGNASSLTIPDFVIDTTAPTVTAAIASNGNGSTIAKASEIITLTITSNENISTPTVTMSI